MRSVLSQRETSNIARTKTYDCNAMWVRVPLEEMDILVLVTRHGAALSFTNQHALPQEFSRNESVLLGT